MSCNVDVYSSCVFAACRCYFRVMRGRQRLAGSSEGELSTKQVEIGDRNEVREQAKTVFNKRMSDLNCPKLSASFLL